MAVPVHFVRVAVLSAPAFFWWWFAYDAYAHEIFVTGGFIAGAGGVAAFVVAVAMSVWRAREVKKVTTYGSARWAEGREIRKAGLLLCNDNCDVRLATIRLSGL